MVKLLGCHHSDPSLARLALEIGAPLRRVVGDLTYLDYRDYGVSFMFNERACLEAIFFYSEGYEGHAGYVGSLPGGIDFHETKDAVRTKLGDPVSCGGGEVGILGKLIPPWEQYDCGEYRMTTQYDSGNGGVNLVTVFVDRQ